MKRTLSQFAAACGGTLEGADADFTEVLIDSRAVRAGDLFLALPGEQCRWPRLRGSGRCGRERPARSSAAASRPHCRRSWSPTMSHRAGARAARVARGVYRHRARRRREQWQDHDQGDAGRDPRAARRVPRRRAAISTITWACRSRCCGLAPAIASAVIEMGANHAGEVAGAGGAGASGGRPDHQRRRRAPRGLRHARRRRARGRRDGRRPRRRCRRGHQRRRCLRAALASHDARARGRFRICRGRCGARRGRCACEVDAQGFAHAFHAAQRRGIRAGRARAGRSPQCQQRARRRGRGARGGRHAATGRRGLARRAARCRAACSSSRWPAAPG